MRVRPDAQVGNREFRVQRRRRIGDIADISGPGALPREDLILLETDAGEMQARALGENCIERSSR